MTEIPPSIEGQVESLRRHAAGLSDYHLDEQIAVTVARRDVAAAHGATHAAEVWQSLLVSLDDVRRSRAEVRREIEELTGPPPPTVRPLTDDELDEWEPPC